MNRKIFFCVLTLLGQICLFSKVLFAASRRGPLLIMPCPCPSGNTSWDQELSADVLFVSVLATDRTVLSEYWQRLEETFFWNDITLRRLWKLYHFEKYSQAFFNILTEPLPVQTLTIHQQKAHDLSYLEPEGQGRGMVRRVPCPLTAKDIEKKSKFNGGKSGCKKFFFRFNF